MKSKILKYIIMGVAAICAIVCFANAWVEGNVYLGIMSLISAFVPIIVWFLDTKENDKETKKLKDEISDLKDHLTIKII